MMRYGWNDNYMMGGGYDGMMLWGWLIGILILVLIVFGIVALIHYLHSSNVNHTGVNHAPPSANNALNILNERYARGELSDQEYAAKKAELRR